MKDLNRFLFFFNDTATTEIYTLSLHDVFRSIVSDNGLLTLDIPPTAIPNSMRAELKIDRKSTRLNSSHLGISYAVFCLKKKKLKSLQRRETLKYIISNAKAESRYHSPSRTLS